MECNKIERLRIHILLFILLFVAIIILILYEPKKPSSEKKESVSFTLEHCQCTRTLPIMVTNLCENQAKIQGEVHHFQFNKTTCGKDAFKRGLHQKVIEIVVISS